MDQTDTPQGPEATARPRPGLGGAISQWAATRKGWVRLLVADVTARRAPPSADRFDEVYAAFLADEIGDPAPSAAAASAASPPADASDAALTLQAIEHPQGVNALAAEHGIEFHPNLTIVFGENGSGKSGYTRIIKRVANVRTAEDILPDVRQQPTGVTPSATIRYRLGDDGHEVQWNNDVGLEPLSRIDVFDSRCTSLHVDRDLAYTYTPREISYFPLVQHSMELVRDRLVAQRTAIQSKRNPFGAQFKPDTRAGKLASALSAATTDAEVLALATVPPDEATALAQHRDAATKLAAASTAADLTLLRHDRSLLERAGTILRLVAAYDYGAYDALRTQVATAEAERAKSASSTVSGAPAPIVPNDEWRAFIRSAEAFLGTIPDGTHYPAEASPCIYCSQALSPDAQNFVRRVRALASGAAEQAYAQADRRFTDARDEFDLADLTPLADEIRRQAPSEEAAVRPSRAVLLQVHPLLTRVSDVRAVLIRGGAVAVGSIAADAATAAAELDQARDALDALTASLQEDQAAREKTRMAHEAAVRDIESRQLLESRRDEVLAYVADLRWAARAGVVEGSFRGLLKSLTQAAKAAGDELLNRRFREQFTSESAALRAPEVTLTFPGREGTVKREKHVGSDFAPSRVLSEGEQKVLALADFLAEVSLKSPAPVVFDDPVNSLDYGRMALVVARVRTLSQERQVVVFTHNIAFANALLESFDEADQALLYYEIECEEDQPGVVSPASNPRTDSVTYLVKRVNELIQKATPEHGAARALLVEKGYAHLRSLCEVIVEKELFQDVVARYRRNVMMTRIVKIPFAKLEGTAKQVGELFGRICGYLDSHSQPLEVLNVRPKLEDLKRDLALVVELRKTYLAKGGS